MKGKPTSNIHLGLVQASVVSNSTMIVHPRPDLGIAAPQSDTPPEIIYSLSITLNPGMDDQFEEYIKKLVEATKATTPDATWRMYQPGIGSAGTWGVRTGMNWKELDTPANLEKRLTDHFGKRAGQRIFQDGQEAIANIETSIRRFRAELSHLPQAD